MPRQIIIAEQHRLAAVFSEDQIQELIVASGHHQMGDIYLGMVENVLPSIDAAFVNIGSSERNGFIHVSDLGPLRLKRSTAPITELVTPQQRVLVQVMKEPTGNKGPRLTGNLSFPGRYLVLMPYGRGVHLSSRIQDEEERNRLKSLAILIKPSQMGLLVRTEAASVSEEAMIEDLEQLKKQWEYIQQQQASTRTPGLLNRDDDFIQRVLRDVYSADVNRIVTDSPLGLKRVRQYLQSWNKGQMPAGVFVDAHRETTPLLEYFRINAVIRQALRPRVDLPSGGYIVIEPTEALTVIDVNSGSFTQSATSRETVLWTNCEAATEIARQLRLRNIAGVIVVDFIDMDLRRDQLQVLEHFNKALRSDKARPQIAQLSELGLVELTRKRQGQSLYEVFGRPCPTCDGLGLLAHLPGAHPDAPDSLISRSPATLGMEAGFARRSEDFGASSDEDLEAPFDPVASLTPSFPGRDRNGGSQRGQARPKGLRPGSGLGRRGRPMPREEYSSAGRDTADAFPFPFTANDAADLEKPDLSEGSSLMPGGRDKILLRDKGERGKLASAEKGRGIGADSGLSAREPRQRDTHPKVITVEMTPLQQKVYSEMGLSPLLLLKAPVSVGRDTAVMVALPGSGGSATRTVSPEPSPDWQPSPSFATAAGTTDAWAPPAPSEPDISAWPPASLDLATDLPLQNPGGSVAAEGSAGEIARANDAPAAPAEAEPKVTPEKQSPAASRRRRSQSKS